MAIGSAPISKFLSSHAALGLGAVASFALVISAAAAPEACEKNFLALASPPPPALIALAEETKRLADSGHSSLHELQIKDGRGHVKIGVLMKQDVAYGLALANAVREGSIAEIDAGKVVGAKVLPMLARMASHDPTKPRIVVRGEFSPHSIMESAEFFRLEDPSSAEYLSEGNFKQLLNAFRKLDVYDACRKIWKTESISQCGPLKFRIESDTGQTHWELGDD